MWQRIYSLIIKEFLAIWKDPKSRIIIIVPPLLELVIFANALTMEVKNIDVVVLDRSNTYESRELISRFERSRWFRHFFYVSNENDFKEKINIQRVQMGIQIDNDFSNKIKTSKTASVQIITDGRQTNVAGIISGYANLIVSQYNADFSVKKGAEINVIVRNWFNPNLEYIWYLLVSIITILALIIALLLTALSIARERELGTFDQLIVSPLTSFEILIGKTIPSLIIAILITCFMVAMSMLFFKMPFVGSKFIFLISTVIALISIVGIGLFISSICNTQQQAILATFVFEMPSILLSGFYSPIENMPVFVQYLTYLNPIRFFINISKGLILKDMLLHDVVMNLIPLVLIAILTLSLAGWTFKRKLD